MTTSRGRTNRRRFLGTAAGTGLALHGLGTQEAPSRTSLAAVQQEATPEAQEDQDLVGQAEMPRWRFSVYRFQDPYPGEIQVPQEEPPGTRYVAAEVGIDNESDQPLNFSPADIRLRDTAGVEYRGGTALGTEPAISPRNMNVSERSRGWVWFTVAAEADLVGLVYAAPQPQLRVDLP